MATTTQQAGTSEPAIPDWAIAALEEKLDRSLEGWDAAPPRYVTPPPDPRAIEGLWFDVDAVVHVVTQLRKLRHWKDRWKGRPLDPDPWQIVWVLAPVFGWKHADGTRVIRTAWIEVPRKNGKTTLSSGIAIILLLADNQAGAEVYAAATSKEQADRVGDDVKEMIRSAPALRRWVAQRRIQVLKDVVRVPGTGSIFRCLSRVAQTAHGLNVSGAVIDEVHVHQTRDLIDAIETGTASREEPLIVMITTANEGDDATIYGDRHNKTIKLADRLFRDETYYGVIWAADAKDDPFDETTWKKANPGYGTSLQPAYMAKVANSAKNTPSELPGFLQLHLNIRTRGTTHWLPLPLWDANAELDLEKRYELAGRTCDVGLDLSETQDTTAYCLNFLLDDGSYAGLWRFFLPSEALASLEDRTARQAAKWAKPGGPLEIHDGATIDYAAVRARLYADAERFKIRDVAIDPFNAIETGTKLMSKGLRVILVDQTFRNLSEPMKKWERLILAKAYHHGGNPVMRWQFSNIVTMRNTNGDIKPNKLKAIDKIDGASAALNAIGRTMLHAERPERKKSRLVTMN